MPTDRLSDDELRTLATLLHRYCEVELDQFEHWRTDTKFGPVYIALSRQPSPGIPPDRHDSIDPWVSG